MLDGIGNAASGLAAQSARMDALANDIANSDTSGYQAQRLSLATTASGGVALTSAGLDTSQGAIEQSGRPLDLAISGNGYFQVGSPSQPVLTRVGAFEVSSNGQLVTERGLPLIPPIQLPPGTDPTTIAVGPNGALTVNGRPIGNIVLVTVPAPGALQPLGGGLLAPTAASGGPAPATAARIQQGALEASNVDPTEAIVGMIEAKASFAFDAGAIRAQDALMRSLLEIHS